MHFIEVVDSLPRPKLVEEITWKMMIGSVDIPFFCIVFRC